MDDDVVYVMLNGILLNRKKDYVMPFVATWMDREVITLREASQRKARTTRHPLPVESKIQKGTYL